MLGVADHPRGDMYGHLVSELSQATRNVNCLIRSVLGGAGDSEMGRAIECSGLLDRPRERQDLVAGVAVASPRGHRPTPNPARPVELPPARGQRRSNNMVDLGLRAGDEVGTRQPVEHPLAVEGPIKILAG